MTAIHLRVYRLLFLCLYVFAQPVAAQVSIMSGQTIEGELASDATDTYALYLDSDQFVVGQALQHTVDVVVTITGPAGERIDRFDTSGRGPERFKFASTDPGAYTITITPFEEAKGRYGLTVDRVEPTATTPEGTVDQLLAWYDEEGSPGGVVGVVRDGELIFSRGYGLADIEHGTFNAPSTPYHTASISKQFTAFAIALLADEGHLSLDDDVRKYLPEVPDFGATITLRQLATHTSGLRGSFALWALSGGRNDDVIRQEDFLSLVERQRELNFEPGTEYLYVSTGYLLLSEVVSRVTGQSFGEWMEANVFSPLGMDDTQIYDDYRRLIPGRAASYATFRGALEKRVLSSSHFGSVGVISTVEDLARWIRNFGTAEVGGPAVASQMVERGVLASGDTLSYALGLIVDEHRGLRRIQHGGEIAGYRTFLAYYPEIDAGVVTMGNVASFPSETIASEVAEAFFSDHMDALEPNAAQVDTGPATETNPIVVPRTRLDAYRGVYQIEEGPRATVDLTEDGLTISIAGRATPLLALSDTLFRWSMGSFDARVSFHVASDGSVEKGIVHLAEREDPFQRVGTWTPPWEPGPAALAAFEGRYYSPELETEYFAHLDGDRLIFVHHRQGEIILLPEAEDVFRSDRWFMDTVRFERDAAGSVNGMRATSGNGRRVRNLYFEKRD